VSSRRSLLWQISVETRANLGMLSDWRRELEGCTDDLVPVMVAIVSVEMTLQVLDRIVTARLASE
jgi:hypothetical protein